MAWSEIILFFLAIVFFALGGFTLLVTMLRLRERSLSRNLLLGMAGVAGLGLSIASAAGYENRAQQRADLAAQPGPTRAQVTAARDMTPEARRRMIEGMVARLAARLRDNPKDLAGWLRLGRVYGVLGRRQDALTAYAMAKRHFPAETARIDRLMGELGPGK
jgi:cytochrome c-type biogenesis protein CcmH/NrfG